MRCLESRGVRYERGATLVRCRYGWGQSFHFAKRWKTESLEESIVRHEHFLAARLGLREGMQVRTEGAD